MNPRSKRRRKKKGRYLRGSIVTLKGGTCRYRSGWELAYIVALESDPTVVSFQYEGLKIPYVSNVRSGRLRNYLPDFVVNYVDGSTVIIEIKPSKRLMNPTVQKKARAAELWSVTHGASYKVLTELELRVMGLLK